jgi:hypothetical protein
LVVKTHQGVVFAAPGTETFVILNRGDARQNITLPNDGGFTHMERWIYRADASVVSSGFAPIPDGPAPWLQGTPMSVVHKQKALDPNRAITFAEPGYSLEFVTLTSDSNGVAPIPTFGLPTVGLAIAGHSPLESSFGWSSGNAIAGSSQPSRGSEWLLVDSTQLRPADAQVPILTAPLSVTTVVATSNRSGDCWPESVHELFAPDLPGSAIALPLVM